MSTPSQRPHTISSTVVSGTPTSHTLSWSHNTTNTINYIIHKSIDNVNYSNATAPTVSVVTNQTSYSCVVSELDLGRKYYLKVTAVGSGGNLQSENYAELTVGNPEITDVSADFGEVLDSNENSGNVDVSLTFSDIDDKFKFKLFLIISSGELLIGEEQITSENASLSIPRLYLLALDQSSSYSFKAKIYDAYTDVQQSHISDGSFSFSTSANLTPTYDNELALGLGDPYISPLIGQTYKLPDEHANYRYLDNCEVNDRFFVNIQTGLLSQSELDETNKYSLDKIKSELGNENMDKWLEKNNLVLPSLSCFVNYIHMRNGESHITIDTKNFNIFSISSFEDFEIENIENGPIDDCFAPYATSIPVSTTKISCETETYGKVSLYVYEFSNLQLRNAFRIETEKQVNLANSIGSMVFKSKSFTIPKLNSEKFVQPALELDDKYIPQLFVTKEKMGAIAVRV